MLPVKSLPSQVYGTARDLLGCNRAAKDLPSGKGEEENTNSRLIPSPDYLERGYIYTTKRIDIRILKSCEYSALSVSRYARLIPSCLGLATLS